MDKKTSLRVKIKEMRACLDIADLSNKIVVQIARQNIYKKSQNIMIFYPIQNEINLLSLLECKDKNFYLPRMKGKGLEICPYKKGDVLKSVKYNIQEPQTDSVSPEVLDLIIVPALAADKNGNRLGYGGGFYDRLLSNLSDTKILCPITESQFFNVIPSEEHDVKMDYIVTEKKFYNIIGA